MKGEYKSKEANADYGLDARTEVDHPENVAEKAVAYHYVHSHKTANSIAKDKKLLGNVCLDDRLAEEYGPAVYVTEIAPDEGMEAIVAGTGLIEPKYCLEVLISKSYLQPQYKIPVLPRSYRIKVPNGEDGIEVSVLRTWNLRKVQRKKSIVRSLTSSFASYI